jgi:hypothetical protein
VGLGSNSTRVAQEIDTGICDMTCGLILTSLIGHGLS